MMSKNEESSTASELDCSNAGRGVWLVKLPKYIAKKWLQGKNFRYVLKFLFLSALFWLLFFYFLASSDVDVGKLKIVKYPGQKSQVSLSLSDTTLQIDPDEKIPKEHRFDVTAVNKQTLGVFSQNLSKSILGIIFTFVI